MDIRKNKAPNTPRTGGGFSAIELLITATILGIVTSVGAMGISHARASVRLSGAAREYATYIEKARLHSIRSHADDASERASIEINEDRTSYDVIMDLDGDGDMDTRTITLPDGVTFQTVETIAFDWRGRTWNTVGGMTMSNAQVSITLQGSTDSISIDVTGSGDITVDSQVFDDSVPSINLHIADLRYGATPTPTPFIETPTPTPTPDAVPTPDNSANPNPTPTPPIDLGDIIPVPTPTPSGRPTATPTPAATPTPVATPTPTPTPILPCILSVSIPSLTLSLDGTATIKVGHDGTSSLSISGTSSKPSDLQVTPGGAQTVAAGGTASFTIKSKKTIGIYSVTFSSGCGTKVVPVVVVGLSLGL